LRTLDLLVELLEDDLRTFERFAAAVTGAAQAVNLLADRLLILRQIVGEGGDLGRENPSEPGDRREGDQDDNHDRERARQPQSLQRPDRGRQHEAQDAGKRERDQHIPSEIHDRHNDHTDQQRVQRRRRRIHVSPKWGCVRTGRQYLKLSEALCPIGWRRVVVASERGVERTQGQRKSAKHEASLPGRAIKERCPRRSDLRCLIKIKRLVPDGGSAQIAVIPSGAANGSFEG
jgi:hypothetical protein